MSTDIVPTLVVTQHEVSEARVLYIGLAAHTEYQREWIHQVANQRVTHPVRLTPFI